MDSMELKPVLNQATPRDSAQKFIDMFHRKKSFPDLACVPSTGEFFVWKDNHYQSLSDLALQAEIAKFLNMAEKVVPAKGIEPEGRAPFNTDSAKENKVLDALRCLSCEYINQDPSITPSWIMGHNIKECPNPLSIIPFKNKLLSINDFLKSGNPFECLLDVTPTFFSTTQIPFNIDPNDHGRLQPTRFLSFLDEVFGGDKSSIDFLQQWFGYCLTNDTSLQKLLLIVGPKRSGKGTIARVLQSMLGEANVIAPSATSMLAANGMEPWLNKRLAIFGDARFGEKIDKDAIKEYLLQISGEDTLTIGRKFKCSVTTKLPIKIMVLSNEIPEFIDSGAALASRFIILKMEKSVSGKEIIGLFEDELKPEIPRIFWWALDGLRKLMVYKRFIQPEGGKESAIQMERNQSPVGAFVSDFCNVKPGLRIAKEILFNAYVRWCSEEEIKPLSPNYFSRFLASACHSVKPIRPKEGGIRSQEFDGISLKDRS